MVNEHLKNRDQQSRSLKGEGYKPKVSVIITTYNRPEALQLVLQSLNAQDFKQAFEVIIADDGSSLATRNLLKKLQKELSFPLYHAWHPKQGFRVAKIRNKAAAIAKGDYLIFLDGDCIPLTSFLRRHFKLAEKNYFVAGNRVLLSRAFTNGVLKKALPIYKWRLWQWLKARLSGFTNRFISFLPLPLGALRKLKAKNWQGAKTCNLGLWRADFLAANGFDETFQGWGYEDSDLVIRLMKNKILRKNGRFAIPVLHLWHAASCRKQSKKNHAILKSRLETPIVKAKVGMERYR